VSGLTPPVPCRTWKESTSTWMVTEEVAGTAVSTLAWPKLEQSPAINDASLRSVLI
jgi:hypothetical protein